MPLSPTLRDYPEAFLRLLYPALCTLCESSLEIHESGLCETCAQALEHCAYDQIEACSSQRFEFLDEAWSLYPYESPAGEILSAVKFFQKNWLLNLFEKQFAKFLLAVTSETSYHALIPIPIDRLRLFEREFNQSELIARLLFKCTGVPVKTILKKTRRTFSQSGLGKRERQVNLFQAFQLASYDVQGKNFLLVDDILTTGATGEEAARLLKRAGARKVDILTIARTESRESLTQ